VTDPHPTPRLKIVTYTVRASREQARRWSRVARHLGCRSVSAWLEELAEEQARRVVELMPETCTGFSRKVKTGRRSRRNLRIE
jgi:hypothetical protein